MIDIILDAECNGLLPMVDTIHVVVVKIVGKPENEDSSFRVVRTREHLLKIIDSGKLRNVVNHNLIGYDLAVFQRVWGIPYTVGANGADTWNGKPVRFIDTFHLSMYLNADRQGHGLEAYGERLGFPKGSHSDWSVYSPEMEAYCRRDVILTSRVYDALLSETNDRL